MPYIVKSRRKRIDKILDLLIEELKRLPVNISGGWTIGDTSYIITRLLHERIKHCGFGYASFNEVIGVLECIKSELYRNIVVPYEDKKKAAAGAISELDS